MTYSEAYQKAETLQELIDSVRHDVLVWARYGRNPDRLKAITTAMNKAAKEKNWNLDVESVFSYCDTIMRVINSQPTIEADIDSAAILRLCNEIEEIVTTIANCSGNWQTVDDCRTVCDKLKEIGKELTGDAGTD